MADSEKNRFSARAARYARVGANVGRVAARYGGRRLLGGEPNRAGEASALASALGNLKGPLMKVAQLMATIPDLLPPEYAEELQKLQSEAPPMGWAFVKRRMSAELGSDWQEKFESFEHHPAAAASLGQVHRARSLEGAALACKLLTPKTVLPIHWGTFPPLTGTPAQLAARVGAGVKVVDWKPGDEISA